MTPLISGGAGVEVQESTFLVLLDHQQMRVAADEKIRRVFVDQLSNAWVVSPWIAAYVRHKNFYALAVESLVLRVHVPNRLIVNVSVNALEWFKGGKFL